MDDYPALRPFTALHMDNTKFNVTRLQDSQIASWLTPSTQSTSCLRLLIGDSRGCEEESVSLLNEGYQFRRIPFTSKTFRHISEVMRLPDDFVQVLQEGTSCSVRFLHETRGQNNRQTLDFIFKVGLLTAGYSIIAITYTPLTKETVGVVLQQTKYPTPQLLTDQLDINRDLWDQPMLVPVMTAKAVSRSNQDKIAEMHAELDSMEDQMQLHETGSRFWGDPASVHFSQAITKIGNANTILAICTMRLTGLLLLLEAVRTNMEIIKKHVPPDNQERHERQSEKLLELVENLENYCRNLLLKAKFDQERSGIYLQVVSMYMAQEVAVANMTIATASKRDSSAATSIALLTMFFLPATCIAVSMVHLPAGNTWHSLGTVEFSKQIRRIRGEAHEAGSTGCS